jgi:hypothetical protein
MDDRLRPIYLPFNYARGYPLHLPWQPHKRTTQYSNLSMVNFAQAVIPPIKDIESVLQPLVNGPCTANNLAGVFPARRRAIFWSLAGCLNLDC